MNILKHIDNFAHTCRSFRIEKCDNGYIFEANRNMRLVTRLHDEDDVIDAIICLKSEIMATNSAKITNHESQ